MADTGVETIVCWPYGDANWCEAVITGTGDEIGKAGWSIGHYDGQGHYVCPEHKNCIYDPRPIQSV